MTLRGLASAALVLAALSLLVSVLLWANARGEERERRDQDCLLFERDHLADIQRLRETVRYLVELEPAELAEGINRAILRSLPNLEREARIDRAPRHCDEPGYGRPEPDPLVPLVPERLRTPPTP